MPSGLVCSRDSERADVSGGIGAASLAGARPVAQQNEQWCPPAAQQGPLQSIRASAWIITAAWRATCAGVACVAVAAWSRPSCACAEDGVSEPAIVATASARNNAMCRSRAMTDHI